MSAQLATNAVWYLMRGSGVVSLMLLTGVMTLGIATTRRWRPGRAPRFVALSLHRSIALLSVVFVAIHVVTAVTDPYAVVSVAAIVVPFVAGRAPFWVGLGALSLDVFLALVVSSLLRARIGLRMWRGIHLLAYASWPVALAHSLGMGSDAHTIWLRAIAAGCIAVVGIATVRRVLGARGDVKHLEPQVA